MSVDYKKISSHRVNSNKLLENARLSDPAENPPELYWILKSGEDNFVLWQLESGLPEEFGALVLGETSEPVWKLTINLWKRYRQISPLEKAFILEHLSQQMSEEELLKEVTEMLSIPRDPGWLDCYRRLTELSSSLREAIHEEKLSPGIFRYIFQLPEIISKHLLEDLEKNKVHLTVQQSRLLAGAFRRISDPSEERWFKICEEAYNFSEQPSQRADKLLELVNKWVYPRINQRYKKFKLLKERLHLWPGLRVIPPENFEGARLDFKFSCGDEETLEKAVASLKKCRRLLKFV